MSANPLPQGVVFFQFSRIRQQSENGSAFLTSEQQEWAELSKMVFRLKPPDKCPVPRNKMRRWDRRRWHSVAAHIRIHKQRWMRLTCTLFLPFDREWQTAVAFRPSDYINNIT